MLCYVQMLNLISGGCYCTFTLPNSNRKDSYHCLRKSCYFGAVYWLRLVLKNSSAGWFSPRYHTISFNHSKLCVIVTACGITEHLSSHSFRYGGATFMAAEGLPIKKIKDRRGWRSNCVYRFINEPLDCRIVKEKRFSHVF